MEISQIQLNYIDVEDRMVLRINMGVEQHLTLVLTRRIVRFMLDSLSVLLQRISPPVAHVPKASAAAAAPKKKARQVELPGERSVGVRGDGGPRRPESEDIGWACAAHHQI